MDFLKSARDALMRDTATPEEMASKPRNKEEPPANTSDEHKLISHIKEKLQRCRMSSSRVAHEGVWLTNAAYALGFTQVTYDTISKQYRLLGNPMSTLRKNRVQINKILPTLQRRLARLCKNPPKWEVRPDDGTEDARDRARLEKKVLEDYWDKECIQEKRLNVVMGAQQYGHYYMKVCWDPTKGEVVGQDEDGFYLYEGDIGVECVSAFEIFPDPLAKNFDEIGWLIQAKVRNLDYFKTHYKNGYLVKEEGVWLLSATYEARINTLTGQGPAQSGIQQQMLNCAIEVAYYEKRSHKHPNGRLVIIANDVILKDDELPVGEIPFAMFSDIPVTGKYYPEAVTTHLRPIQDQFVRLVSQRTSWTNKLLAGKYIAAKGSSLDQEAMNDQSGEIVYYKPVPNAAPPQAMSLPVIPQYAYTEEDRLNSMFYDIAGEGEVSRGILPSASIPAVGMQLLLEQDQTRISVITDQHEHAFARLGKLILLYAEKYITTEKMIKLAGPSDQYLIKSFTGKDLESAHDVIVIKGSLANQSTAVKRNDIINAWQAGLYGNPQDQFVVQKVFKSLEFGDVDGAWEDQALDMAQIKYTMEQIDNGLQPDVHELDNHPLHIQEKNRVRKTEKFRNYDDHKKALLLADIEAHLQFMTGFQAAAKGLPVNPEDDVDLHTQAIDNELRGAEMQSSQQELAMRAENMKAKGSANE